MGLLDPPTIIILKDVPNLNNKIYASSSLGSQVVTDRIVTPSQPVTVNTLVNGAVTRTLINGAQVIRFMYANVRAFAGAGMGGPGGTNGEGLPPNPIHVKAGIAYTNSVAIPITFGGKSIATIQPGGHVISDPVAIEGAAGSTFVEQVCASPPMPPVVTAAPSTTGGALGANTYWFKATSVTDGGESNASSEVSATTTGSTGSVSLNIADLNMQGVNVKTFNIYVSTASGAEIFVGSIPASERTFIYTGASFAFSTTMGASASGVALITLATTAGLRGGDTLVIGGSNYVIQNVVSSTQVYLASTLTASSGAAVTLLGTPPSTSQGVIPNCTYSSFQTITSEGSLFGLDTAYGRQSSVLSDNSPTFNIFAANAIIGQPSNSLANPAPPIFCVGDSIGAGIGDEQQTIPSAIISFYSRALNQQFPYVNVSVGGETAANFAIPAGSSNRMTIAQCCKYSMSNYGTNDLGGGQTASQIMANTVKIAQNLIDAGITKHYQTTLIPRTQSTDGWQTFGNQTTNSYEAARQTVNQWLRAPITAGAGNSFLYDVGTAYQGKVGIFDTGAALEYNSGGTAITINPATGAISNGSGGLWNVFGSTSYLTNVGAISGSASNLIDTGQSMTTDAWAGYCMAITIGGVTHYAEITANTATEFFTSGIGAVPTTGTTYYVYKCWCLPIDGTHPSTFGHIAMAGAINTGLFV